MIQKTLIGFALPFLLASAAYATQTYEISNVTITPVGSGSYPNYYDAPTVVYNLTSSQVATLVAGSSYFDEAVSRVMAMSAGTINALDTATKNAVNDIRSNVGMNPNAYDGVKNDLSFYVGIVDPLPVSIQAGDAYEFDSYGAVNDAGARYLLLTSLISFAGDQRPQVFSYLNNTTDPLNHTVNFQFDFACPVSTSLVIQNPSFTLDSSGTLPLTVLSGPTQTVVGGVATCHAVFQLTLPSDLSLGSHVISGTIRFDLLDGLTGIISHYVGHFSMGVQVGSGADGGPGDGGEGVQIGSGADAEVGATQKCGSLSGNANPTSGLWPVIIFMLISVVAIRRRSREEID